MSDATDPRFLEVLPSYLRTLGEDAMAVAEVLRAGGSDATAERYLIASLNYVFKSLDLIPDSVDDVGFLDDAFVLRVGADLATLQDSSLRAGVVARLAGETRDIRVFLGSDYGLLVDYVGLLCKGAARGRTVEEILLERAARDAFLAEVQSWAKTYRPPAFTRDVRTLVKLKAYLNAKLA